MFKHYKKTHLEDFVEQLYIQHDILTPEDITVPTISKGLTIKIEYARITSMSHRLRSGKHVIILDERGTPQKQRGDFLHELGHLLRHEGNQLLLPKPFVQYQEEDAEQFILYALLPFFMIECLELSPDRKQAVQQLAETFTVGTELASKRYNQIMRREYEGAMTTEAAAAKLGKEVNCRVADKTQIMAFYDPSGTYDGPSQLIIILDEWTLINCREIELPIGERFQEIGEEELRNYFGTPVSIGDVICFDGKVTLMVYELVRRYGLSRNTFIIHMRDVDMLIARDQAIIRKLDW
ncbi:ImmA/IrrE family metallo-endopeptidase [Paenibacillus zanthoxyli]|uniref:ImmA/IrrE family metallo-endopeptidase n=1 Tax=Paenibacillus zanthoxyli TaxID=369399 RepID=UPI00047045A8|nr:ImmA/IrrE family metallo-endopeptidase [Paenibacillus zanthoxyli]